MFEQPADFRDESEALYQLLAPLQEGMAAPPHAMAPHMEERDYFLGKVHSASPEQHAEADQITEGGAH